MLLHKFILSFILLFLYLTPCNCQVVSASKKQIIDTSIEGRLTTFRQIFWDSLPKSIGWTNDFEGLFTDTEIQKLDSIIAAFEKETTVQICIITLDTTYITKEKFNDLALHIFKTWGVGQKDKNNGVTITISKGHRRIRICNGYGIEKILSDAETKEIMDKYFIANFKEEKYFKGIRTGLIALIETLRIKMK